ncbi:MAG: HAMP domain-containing protein [Spirochaetales bacterium]|nr:HAMP domain-containing protein [Spirochaetales bacterium]
MFKNMKMGVKMALGFGIIIVLVAIVGGISIMNMVQIKTESMKLKDEYVPEVAIANDIERSSLLTMYAMRGYALSFEDNYLQTGEETLQDVFRNLEKAKEHAINFPNLTALKTGTESAMKEAEIYQSLAEETKTEINSIIALRNQTDLSAKIFMENCLAYLDSQNIAMQQEIEEEATPAALSRRLQKITYINDIIDLGNSLRISNFKGQLLNDTDMMKSALSDFSEVENIIKDIRSGTSRQVNIQQLSEIQRTGDDYSKAMESIITGYINLNGLNTERGDAADQVLAASQNVAMKGIETTQEIAVDAVNKIQSSVILILIGVAIALVIALFVAVFLSKLISIALIKGVDFAKELSDGDLTADLDVVQKDELGDLAEALRNMRDRLAEIVGSVSSGAEQIASASEELASGNQDLSNRTEQQASALEETSSAIEEMNASIKSNADNTQTAEQLARDTVKKSEEGSLTVDKMVSAMDEINISSNKIADIIEVITNIAFQTNLLALNASIEAARAGEQGKGFAVVAVEVRKLAKRSDKAANEITAIIKNSNQKVNEGVDIANKAGVVLQEINDSVKKVTTLVVEISAASQEQLSSSDEIDKTLTSLDENTQKNAALVEEAASATEELSAQAQELNSAMRFFKIDSKKSVKSTKDKKTNTIKALPPASTVSHKKEGESYQSFSELVDEGEFDEF